MLPIRVGIHVKSLFLNLAILGCTIFRFMIVMLVMVITRHNLVIHAQCVF